MGDSMREILRRDMECEGLLECMHGFRTVDEQCFWILVESDEPLLIDDLSERVDRDRSTVYRAVQRLLKAGVVKQEQINYQQGGYCHVYRSTESGEIADRLQYLLNDWYANVDHLIDEFRDTYASQIESEPTPEH